MSWSQTLSNHPIKIKKGNNLTYMNMNYSQKKE